VGVFFFGALMSLLSTSPRSSFGIVTDVSS